MEHAGRETRHSRSQAREDRESHPLPMRDRDRARVKENEGVMRASGTSARKAADPVIAWAIVAVATPHTPKPARTAATHQPEKTNDCAISTTATRRYANSRSRTTRAGVCHTV